MNVTLTHWRDEESAISLRPDGYWRVRGPVSQGDLRALDGGLCVCIKDSTGNGRPSRDTVDRASTDQAQQRHCKYLMTGSHVMKRQRLKLSDPARGTRGLPAERDGWVRGGVWLGKFICVPPNSRSRGRAFLRK